MEKIRKKPINNVLHLTGPAPLAAVFDGLSEPRRRSIALVGPEAPAGFITFARKLSYVRTEGAGRPR